MISPISSFSSTQGLCLTLCFLHSSLEIFSRQCGKSLGHTSFVSHFSEITSLHYLMSSVLDTTFSFFGHFKWNSKSRYSFSIFTRNRNPWLLLSVIIWWRRIFLEYILGLSEGNIRHTSILRISNSGCFTLRWNKLKFSIIGISHDNPKLTFLSPRRWFNQYSYDLVYENHAID